MYYLVQVQTSCPSSLYFTVHLSTPKAILDEVRVLHILPYSSMGCIGSLAILAKLTLPKARSLLWLSRELATLLPLLYGYRGQSIFLLDLNDLECDDRKLILRFDSNQTIEARQTHGWGHLLAYSEISLCVVHTFQGYFKWTKPLWKAGVAELFLIDMRSQGLYLEIQCLLDTLLYAIIQ